MVKLTIYWQQTELWWQVLFTLFFLLADCVHSFMTDLRAVMVPSSVIFTFTLETNPVKSWVTAYRQKHQPIIDMLFNIIDCQ